MRKNSLVVWLISAILQPNSGFRSHLTAKTKNQQYSLSCLLLGLSKALFRTDTACSVIYYMMWNDMIRYDVMWLWLWFRLWLWLSFGMIWYYMIWYDMIRYDTIQYNMIWYGVFFLKHFKHNMSISSVEKLAEIHSKDLAEASLWHTNIIYLKTLWWELRFDTVIFWYLL